MLLGITSKSVQHETSFSLFKDGLCPFLVAYFVGVFFSFFDVTNKNPDEPHKLSILEVNWKFLRKKLRHLPENVFKLG